MASQESIGLWLIADHVRRVQSYMMVSIHILLKRMTTHDLTKYSEEEFALVIGKSLLDSLAYNGDEYKAALSDVKDAVSAHYANNSHHPEHYINGVVGMSLFDLIEMLCDWQAAGETSRGSLEASIESNTDRFDLSPEMVGFLRNTAAEMGLLREVAND